MVVGGPVPSNLNETQLGQISADTLQLLENRPGATIQDVAGHFGLAHSSATSRLEMLHRHGMLWRERHGNRLLHFAGPGKPPGDQILAALSRDQRHVHLLAYLQKTPVVDKSIHRVSKEAGLPYGYVHRTLRFLHRCGLVRLEQRAGAYRLTKTAPSDPASRRARSGADEPSG